MTHSLKKDSNAPSLFSRELLTLSVRVWRVGGSGGWWPCVSSRRACCTTAWCLRCMSWEDSGRSHCCTSLCLTGSLSHVSLPSGAPAYYLHFPSAGRHDVRRNMTTCLPPGPGNIDPHRSSVCPTGAAAVSYFSLSSHRVTGLQLPSYHIINILTKTAGYHKLIVLTHLYGDTALHCTCPIFRDNNDITNH